MRLTTRLYCATLLALATLFAALAPARPAPAGQHFKATTVFLVRHAEKQTGPSADPPLSAEGQERARRLARLLGKSGVRAIYTSQFVRTKETARPLADAAGVAPTVVPVQLSASEPTKVTEQSLKDLVGRVEQRPGETALIVGHTNTVPQVIAMLGGDVAVGIPETEFDHLYVLTVYEPGKAKVAQLRY